MILRFLKSARGILVATTFTSYALGLLRDRLFAHVFGASRALDTYQAAFLIPDFMLNFLVAGGLTAVFVPLFLDIRQKNPARAEAFADTMITVAGAAMLMVGLLLFVFARPLAALVAPGFDSAERELLVGLMRVLAFSPTIFAVSTAFGSILVADGKFLTYGLSPVFYNLGIIAGTLLLAPRFGIYGVAYGTIGGAVLHLLVRLYELRQLRLPLRFKLDVRLPELKPFFRLMVPKMLGHPAELATLWGYTVIASSLSAGSIAVLNFARNFQNVPVSLIGITFATASFPILASAHAQSDRAAFTREYKRTLLHITLLSAGVAFLMYLCRHLIVAVLLGGGRFDASAVNLTATMLGVFMLSVPLDSIFHIQARAFYAAKNTWLPVVAAIANLVLSVVPAWYFSRTWGLVALPVWFAAGSLAKIVLLGIFLPRHEPRSAGILPENSGPPL